MEFIRKFFVQVYVESYVEEMCTSVVGIFNGFAGAWQSVEFPRARNVSRRVRDHQNIYRSIDEEKSKQEARSEE